MISAAAAVARQLTKIKATNTSTIWSRLRRLPAAAPREPTDPLEPPDPVPAPVALLTSQCRLGHILEAAAAPAAAMLLLQRNGMTVFGH